MLSLNFNRSNLHWDCIIKSNSPCVQSAIVELAIAWYQCQISHDILQGVNTFFANYSQVSHIQLAPTVNNQICQCKLIVHLQFSIQNPVQHLSKCDKVLNLCMLHMLFLVSLIILDLSLVSKFWQGERSLDLMTSSTVKTERSSDKPTREIFSTTWREAASGLRVAMFRYCWSWQRAAELWKVLVLL